MDKEFSRIMDEVSRLTREERYELLLRLEKQLDTNLACGFMSQQEAWDGYFALLHECDESGFTEDRPRILSKIDTNRYNPLHSKDPNIVMLARIRLGSGEDPKTKETKH